MSVPDISTPEPTGGKFFSPAQERALSYLAQAEKSGADQKFQLISQVATQFSLLPASQPPIERREWSRENDFATVVIGAGRVFDQETKKWVRGRLPGGGYSNLILLSLLARVRDQAERGEDPRHVDLTPTLNGFSTELGLSRGGKTHKRLLEALQATLGASIQLYRVDEVTRYGIAGTNLQMSRADIASKYSLWLPSQSTLPGFEPFVEVSEFMVEFACAPGAVPVRLDLIARLAGKPYAQQALMWLAREVYVLEMQGKPERVYEWASLYRNITHDVERADHFQVKWRRALDEALNYFPDARPYLDLAHPDPQDGRKRVIRLRRGARPLIQPKKTREVG
jgi:hypothetical protein